MSLPFEFIVDGPPVSQQAKKASRRRAWQARVSQAASEPWSSHGAIAGDVAVAINYFCSDPWADRRESLDVDNVPKPILDALKGIVYIDDKQVIGVECHRRNLHDDLRWDGATAVLYPTCPELTRSCTYGWRRLTPGSCFRDDDKTRSVRR